MRDKPMTSAELFALWGPHRECWPDFLGYEHFDSEATWFVKGSPTLPDAASLLLEASAVRWLMANRRGSVEMWNCGDHFHGNNSEHSESLSHALAAAVGAVKAERKQE